MIEQIRTTKQREEERIRQTLLELQDSRIEAKERPLFECEAQ